MNKKELIETMASKSDITKADAQRSLNALVDTIIEEMKEGNKVSIAGFGSFEKILRQERVGINPITKEKVIIEAKYSPKFKAAKNFKDIIA